MFPVATAGSVTTCGAGSHENHNALTSPNTATNQTLFISISLRGFSIIVSNNTGPGLLSVSTGQSFPITGITTLSLTRCRCSHLHSIHKITGNHIHSGTTRPTF